MDERAQKTVLRWWQSMMLNKSQLDVLHIPPAPSVNKAQLKRCHTAESAMLSAGFRALWLGLDDAIINDARPQQIECWATIAVALVHVTSNAQEKFAAAAGKKSVGDKSLVSELRFAQLQSAKSPDDFLRRMRRIIQQLKGNVDVVSLAADIQQWFIEYGQSRPTKGKDRVSVRWAMDYYRAAPHSAK